MNDSKIDFGGLLWEEKARGIRSKSVERDGKRFRLVEFVKPIDHPDWCETGHFGNVIEGELEIDFDVMTEHFSKDDALSIPEGREFRHIAKPLTSRVVLFLVEEI